MNRARLLPDCRTGLLRWLAAALLLLGLLVPAHAATYTYRSDSYSWETAANLVSWSGGCTKYPGDDDRATVSFTGGLKIPFAGKTYTQLVIHANGAVQFGTETGFHTAYDNTTLPAGTPTAPSGCSSSAPANLLLVYWTDLNPSQFGSGRVYWEQKGTAPNRYVVVSWNSVYEYGTKTPYSAQVVLYESGEYKFQYGNTNSSGSNATIGVQVSSSDYTQYSFNSGYNTSGTAIRWFKPTGDPTRLADYRFDEQSWSGKVGEVADSSGNGYGGVRVGTAATTATARICRALDVPANTSSTVAGVDTGINVSSGIGAQGSVSFWYRANSAWSSTTDAQLLDATASSTRPFHLARRASGTLRFAVADSGGTVLTADTTAQSVGAGTWVHVAATWRLKSGTNQSVLRLYVNGVLAGSSTGSTTGSIEGSLATLLVGDNRGSSTSYGATANSANGQIDELRLYNYEVSTADLALDIANTHDCLPPIHHVEIRHASGSGVTCSPSTVTIAACQDAACASTYTGGLSGTLTATGTGITVNWPAGAAFSIAAGSSTTTLSFQQTTPGSVLLGFTGLSIAPTAATTCNFGSPGCTFTSADSGLLLEVANHVADVAQSLSITAVRKSDNSAACTPAFASVTKAVTFRCGYLNPASGTLPVRVAGSALNVSGSTAAACDGTGRSLNLAFDANGRAGTTVQYADVGSVSLSASYAGGLADAGLSLTGSASFITAPYQFTLSTDASARVAGVAFTGSVTARNISGTVTPNFGRETTAERVSLGWVRTQPQGSGTIDGSWSGSLGTVSGGVTPITSFQWAEVGRGDLTAVLASGSYLGSGYTAAGSTAGTPALCATEWGTCTVPAGATATVYYGLANGQLAARAGMSGDVWCANAAFGDPAPGYTKSCWYVATGGRSTASAGAVGPFRPHHFDVTATPACNSFTYAGQPFSVSVTARNGLSTPTTTVNYDGQAGTSPAFAKAVTLSDALAVGDGSFGSTGALAAGTFRTGTASVSTVAYDFTQKLTAARALSLRAIDSDGVSSQGQAEPSVLLRSGQLRVFNAFGSEKSTLSLPVQAQFWNGRAWVLNDADSCSVVPAAALARAIFRDHQGNAATAWTGTDQGTSLVGGHGSLVIAAPPAGTTGSIDLSLNLGSTGADTSCLATHPVRTGAGLPWLRSRHGACAAGWAADPAARATFGVDGSRELRRTVHVREVF